jgi:hypothetical protein
MTPDAARYTVFTLGSRSKRGAGCTNGISTFCDTLSVPT